MSSVALHTWKTTAARALDQIVAAHSAVGGRGRGRRYAAQEIDHAYAVLLSSQFQRFCRDLHTEAVSFVAAAISPPAVAPLLWDRFVAGRKLDIGNPNPGNIGADFGRFDFEFWYAVRQRDRRNERRRVLLEHLMAWRNAIAHQDFSSARLVPAPPLRHVTVESWRSACVALAPVFERVVADRLERVVGARPRW